MWDKDLQGNSLEIAKTNRSPLRVIAGPGTGKTFALIRRVARLVEEGNDPSRILLVTFTRVSAADLEHELEKLGISEGQRVVKGTLHSFSFSILHRHNVFEFTHRIPRPLLEFEERFLLEDLKLYGDFGDFYQRQETLRAFEAGWARELDQQPGWPITPSDQSFQSQLDEWLIFHKGMLLNEIIPQTLKYLRANPESPVFSQFDHVLVDEYQDLNSAEQSLIDLIAQNSSLTIVGDQDQAIYEFFRYAHPEGISRFHETHENTYDVPLEISRRCSASIVSLANALISNNSRRSNRTLVPSENHTPVAVNLIQWPDVEEEACGIADFIASRVNDGRFDPGQILILCARRQYGQRILLKLHERKIQAFSYFDEEELGGNPKKIEESYAQQAFTILTLLAKEQDNVALRTWLGYGHTNLRNKEYARLRDYCARTGVSTFEALNSIIQGSLDIPYMVGLVERFRELLKILCRLKTLNFSQAFDSLFPPGEQWTEPFREMYNLALTEGPLDFLGVYDLFLTNLTQPELPSNVSFVRIMSLYKSKGLTADHVFVLGCIEGLVPSYPRDELPPEAERRFHEEQRRLFYVAITRARHTLVLSSTSTVPRPFARQMRIPIRGYDPILSETISSTFLMDLGVSCPTSMQGREWLSI